MWSDIALPRIVQSEISHCSQSGTACISLLDSTDETAIEQIRTAIARGVRENGGGRTGPGEPRYGELGSKKLSRRSPILIGVLKLVADTILTVS